eukprot:847858_1
MSNPSESIVPNTPNSEMSAHAIGTISPPDSPPRGTNIRGRWTHNPVVLAALACSNMQSCEEVKNIFQECQKNKSDSMVCEAAEKYYRMCHLKNGGD